MRVFISRRSSFRFGQVLIVVGLTMLGCGVESGQGPESESEALRLIEETRTENVDWTGSPDEAPKRRIALVPLPSPSAQIGRYFMPNDGGARDDRVALKSPAGTVYRFDVTIPSQDPILSLGLGFEYREEDEGKEIEFSIALVDEKGRQPLLQESMILRAEEAWMDREIELDSWAGREVELVLETRSEEEARGAWSIPEIRSADLRDPGYDVILVVIDTLRADGLSSYGNSRPTSPELDRLAEEGYRFESAVSQAPWTRPSHRSLFSGLYPNSTRGLTSRPLAALFWEAGYRTAAITGGGQLSKEFGFVYGFETYASQDWVNDSTLLESWLKAHRNRRSFLFLHTFEVHDPYRRDRFAKDLPSGRLSPGFDNALWKEIRGTLSEEERHYVRALYDSGVARVDEVLGRILEGLRQDGTLEQTLVIVTSDHGEQFFERDGWRHGMNLHDEQVHVPLIVRLPATLRSELEGEGWDPENPSRVIETPVRLIDIYPTLLDLLGLPLERKIQGRSLRPFLAGEEKLDWPPAFSEATNIPVWRQKSLRSGDLKFILSASKERRGNDAILQLYDLDRDPGETRNLSELLPDELVRLRDLMGEIVRGERRQEDEEVVPEDISDELKEQLEALGYLD